VTVALSRTARAGGARVVRLRRAELLVEGSARHPAPGLAAARGRHDVARPGIAIDRSRVGRDP
jgi:hypothetical protein